MQQAIESIEDNVICSCGAVAQCTEFNGAEVVVCPNCCEQSDLSVDEKHIYVPITEEQKEYSEYMGKKIKEDKEDDENGYTPNYMGNTGEEVNYLGVLGETIIADLLNKERPQLLENDVDDGYDFIIQGSKVDVKTTDYQGSDVCLTLYPYEMGEKDVERFLHVRLDLENDVAELLMNIEYNEFVKRNTTRDFGYGKRLTIALDEAEDDILINP